MIDSVNKVTNNCKIIRQVKMLPWQHEIDFLEFAASKELLYGN